ncbi:hypothetical protein GCM10023342_25910 [Modicisalibacter zincidurans]|uniref:Uncharacterized protein n=1 Tax=Modicisalibacter zincidurans TaxID=1178777 RepID=A0ABP9RGX1_9GAMM
MALPLVIFHYLGLVLGDHGLDHDVLHLAGLDANAAIGAPCGQTPAIDAELDHCIFRRT